MEKDNKAPVSPGQNGSVSAATDGGYNEAEISRKMWAAIKLILMFAVVYFAGALVATREMSHIAQIEIASLPLAFYTGVLVFVVGIIVTRMCLNLDNKK